MSDEGMTKYGVVTEDEKTKTASKGNEIVVCPVCGEEVDNANACPTHGTKPFEPDGQ